MTDEPRIRHKNLMIELKSFRGGGLWVPNATVSGPEMSERARVWYAVPATRRLRKKALTLRRRNSLSNGLTRSSHRLWIGSHHDSLLKRQDLWCRFMFVWESTS